MKVQVSKDMADIFGMNMAMTRIDASRGSGIQRIAISEYEREWKTFDRGQAAVSEASESTVEPEFISNSEPESFNDGGSDRDSAQHSRESLKEQLGGFIKKDRRMNVKYNPRGGAIVAAAEDQQRIANSSPEAFAMAYGSVANTGIWKRIPKQRNSGEKRKIPKEEFREVVPVGLVNRNAKPNLVDEDPSFDRSGLIPPDLALAQPCMESIPLPKWFAPSDCGASLNSILAPRQPCYDQMPDYLNVLVAAAFEQGLIADTSRFSNGTQPVTSGRRRSKEMSL